MAASMHHYMGKQFRFGYRSANQNLNTAKYGDPYSEFVLYIYPSKCTYTAVNTHTHREHTPKAHPGEQLGVSVPCSRAPRHGIKGGESTGHSLPH